MNGLDPDDELLLGPLTERGIQAEAAVWDDPAVDWAAFDLAVIRSTWDYHGKLGDFLAWVRRVPRLANPATAVEWNTDKRYLRELAAAGIPGGAYHLDRARRTLATARRRAGGRQAGRQRRRHRLRPVRSR
jgi:hypothetical protein